MFVAYQAVTQRTEEIFDTSTVSRHLSVRSKHGVKTYQFQFAFHEMAVVSLPVSVWGLRTVAVLLFVFPGFSLWSRILQAQTQIPQRKPSCVLIIILFFQSLSVACENWISSYKAQHCHPSAPSVCIAHCDKTWKVILCSHFILHLVCISSHFALGTVYFKCLWIVCGEDLILFFFFSPPLPSHLYLVCKLCHRVSTCSSLSWAG